MSNPHYLPEVCIKVTIINFTVTKSGLEDQLLRYVLASPAVHSPPASCVSRDRCCWLCSVTGIVGCVDAVTGVVGCVDAVTGVAGCVDAVTGVVGCVQ